MKTTNSHTNTLVCRMEPACQGPWQKGRPEIHSRQVQWQEAHRSGGLLTRTSSRGHAVDGPRSRSRIRTHLPCQLLWLTPPQRWRSARKQLSFQKRAKLLKDPNSAKSGSVTRKPTLPPWRRIFHAGVPFSTSTSRHAGPRSRVREQY